MGRRIYAEQVFLFKNFQNTPASGEMVSDVGGFMEQWRKDSRKEAVVTYLEVLVPKDHLLGKVEKVMDYEWLYEKLDPYYCHDNGRPGIGPVVVLIKEEVSKRTGSQGCQDIR